MQALQDSPAHAAPPDPKVPPDHWDPKDRRANPASQASRASKDRRARRAPQDPKVPPGRLVRKAREELVVNLVPPALWAPPEKGALLATVDSPGRTGWPDPRVLQVNAAPLVLPVPKVPPVTPDVPESPGCPERGVSPAAPAMRDLKAKSAPLVLLARMAAPAPPDLRVLVGSPV